MTFEGIERKVRLESFSVTSKPWGREVLIDCNKFYALKLIVMNKGTRCSLQSHTRKLETIFVESGLIELEIVGDDGNALREKYGPGEAYRIEPGTIHRVTVLQDSTLYEVSTPELDDVIRHEDDFGRK
jgi:mannose-6-phosphate isomerase